MGVVSGAMLVNGQQRDSGFQRKTGYVQQQDLHLATSTVREALTFSALLRQPKSTPRQEKIDYVDEVIKLLEMEAYADAIVGVPGEGLNVEQRKRLTIGVEMAAKPQLLLFLDEPTSGLDSQTAWSICALLRKLAINGQAILCTIHQPSAVLFQQFDRLLFLAKGGRTVYFGDIGPKSQLLTRYFESKGARRCGAEENPAEWMLDIIGAAPGSQNTIDWPQEWQDSQERQRIKATLIEMKEKLAQRQEGVKKDPAALQEFAAPFSDQLYIVTKRVFEQYWRTPSYLYSKALLCTSSVRDSLIESSIGNLLIPETGSLHRFLVLESCKKSSGSPESVVLDFHANYHLQQPCPANDAAFCHPACPLRGPRASLEDLLLESLHSFQHYSGDPMEYTHGGFNLCLLVLPHWHAP